MLNLLLEEILFSNSTFVEWRIQMTPLEKANQYQEANRIDAGEKPAFHITPPIGWMNDPNGFSVYQGKIHLFFQYHPYSDVWGPMHWGHCISDDFITWQELPVALAPDQDYDAGGCFSGSAITTEDGHALVYTGVIEQKQEDGSKALIQQQCLAVGDGIQYNKTETHPVIEGRQLPEGFSREDFRDPKVWKEDGTYYLVAANKNAQQNGQVVLFQSKDLRSWDYVSVLADNQGIYGIMWECPDFFALDGKHVLVVSPQDMQADGKEFHNGNQSAALIGVYDRQQHRLLEEQIVSLDYGTDFYAPQTLQAEDGRRILIAWMHSWDMNIKPAEQKWNGMMTLPRQIELKDGMLIQNPVQELEQYRTEPVSYPAKEIAGTCTLPGLCGRIQDLTVEIIDGDYETFSIDLAANERYSTRFCYHRTTQTITFDRTYCGMRRDAVCQRTMKIKKPMNTLKLRFILDKYSVELFVNDGTQTFTSTFYTPLDAEDIILSCDKKAVVNIMKYKLQID